MLERNVFRKMYSLANMQLETQEECELFEDSSIRRMCALWTFFMIELFYVFARSAC